MTWRHFLLWKSTLEYIKECIDAGVLEDQDFWLDAGVGDVVFCVPWGRLMRP
jgi:hypothetical protein